MPQPSTRSLQHIYQVQLGRFFSEHEFTADVKDTLFSIVSAAIGIYYRMLANMRPTPTKSHYTFNCRDLSHVNTHQLTSRSVCSDVIWNVWLLQVVRGMMQASSTVIFNADNVAHLYAHEATRVFHDRLVDDEDRLNFFELLADNLHDYFKVRSPPLPPLPPSPTSTLLISVPTPLPIIVVCFMEHYSLMYIFGPFKVCTCILLFIMC